MAILGYQVVIALAIVVSAGFGGRKGLWTATVLASLWTLTHVFMPWLMALQFVTIAVAHNIGASHCSDRDREGKE